MLLLFEGDGKLPYELNDAPVRWTNQLQTIGETTEFRLTVAGDYELQEPPGWRVETRLGKKSFVVRQLAGATAREVTFSLRAPHTLLTLRLSLTTKSANC